MPEFNDRRPPANFDKRLRVAPQHVEAIRAKVSALDTPERRQKYLTGDFPRADRVKDLDMRYRWDLLHEAKAHPGYDGGINDTHVDSALKRAVPPLAPKKPKGS